MKSNLFRFISLCTAVFLIIHVNAQNIVVDKTLVWIDNTQEPKMKLILAAAATAIMQLKLDEVEAAE